MFHHLMRRANRERLSAQRAVRRPHRGEQHPQVVGDVGHRADRRTGIGADGLLIDGHDRRQTVDEIDVRLFQLADEAFRKRRHRRQQAPLPFGIDRVEGERRLAGAAHAGDDDQLVARNFHVDILQVVLARPVNLDGRSHIKCRVRYAGSSTRSGLRLVSLNGAESFCSKPFAFQPLAGRFQVPRVQLREREVVADFRQGNESVLLS